MDKFQEQAIGLIGRTFNLDGQRIGDKIERLVGGACNKSPLADCNGEQEVKSRKVGSLSAVSLGGKSSTDINEVQEQVYNKIKNLIIVYYELLDNNTFIVTSVTFLSNLDKDSFKSNYKRLYFSETRHGQTSLRAYENNLYKLYNEVQNML